MNNLGIIVEYNPFHKGHQLHIKKSIQKTNADNIIAVMSGNYTQRGEVAIYDKFTRAKCAVDMGVNLVLELPLMHSISSAEYFCFGAVNILNSLGIIDYIVFGSENNTEIELNEIYNDIKSIKFQNELNKNIKTGISYAKALSKTLNARLCSNEILGLNYIKALNELNSNIKPIAIKRESSKYLDINTNGEISSARSIRKKILNDENYKEYLPELVYQNIKNKRPLSNKNIFNMIIHSILSNDDLKDIYSTNEGLDNLILSSAYKFNDYENFINNMVSTRYSRTRIQRLLIYNLLKITTKKRNKLINNYYIRPLAFDKKGKEILNTIKKTATIPIINNNFKNKIEKHELFASNLYYFLSNENRFLDLKKQIYYKK